MVKAFKSRQAGTFLILVLLISVIFLIFLFPFFFLLKFHSQEATKLVWRERLYSLANDGYISSLAQLATDPGLRAFDTSVTTTTYGVRSSSAIVVGKLPGDVKDVDALKHSVYLVVNATLTVANAPPPKHLELTTYISLSDASRFFGASKATWGISQLANCSTADYYGRDVTIRYRGSTGSIPVARHIFYSNSATLFDLDQPKPYNPVLLDPTMDCTGFITVDGAIPMPGPPQPTGKVVQLDLAPVFPPLGPSNMNLLISVATAGYVNSYFGGNASFPDDIVSRGWATSTDIYPPGCTNASCSNLTTNAQFKNHVYFVNGDLTLKGIVHGQIVFVATGKIIVDGDIISDSLTGPSMNYDNPDTPYPACPSPCYADKATNVGREEASNAHQAVLITPDPSGVLINNTSPSADLWTTPPHTLTVEAFIVVPNGGVGLQTSKTFWGDWTFNGALILGTTASTSDGFKNVGLNYMQSLAPRPPPYVPSFTQLQIWHEHYE